MKSISTALARSFQGLVLFIAVLIAFLIPIAYFVISYQYLSGSVESEIYMLARSVEKIAQNNPETWQFEEIRLEEIMRRRIDPNVKDSRIIRGLNGEVIAQLEQKLSEPTITRSHAIYDSGSQVATIEISRSIFPLVYKTILISACSFLFAALLFLAFHIFPPKGLKQAYQAIIDNNLRLRRAEQIANLGSGEYDLTKETLKISDGAARIFGLSGKDPKIADIMAATLPEYRPELKKAVSEMLKNGKPFSLRFKIRRPSDGKTADILSYAEIDLTNKIVFGVAQDVTDLTKAEEEKANLENQLLQSQKMETIGQLAGGIAHDFNNILTAISGFSFLLKIDVKDNPSATRRIDQIIAATDRAADLTKSLLSFSRKHLNNPQLISINETILSAENMMSSLAGERIKINLNLTPKNTCVIADSNQIMQVLMNLTANARDAMPCGGVITITTERVDSNEISMSACKYENSSSYILLTFSDSGSGMPEQIRRKIFEPFFTTKEPGKGTGLGLSIVYGIVKRHGGAIDVQSEEGEGTTFRIFLPAQDTEPEKNHSYSLPQYERFSGTVLIVDDDKSTRQAIGEMLQVLGFTVLTAKCGDEAVSVFRDLKDEIQLILMDVIMPDKSGVETFYEITAIRPDVKVIFISGYSIENISDNLLMEDRVGFISKPISPKKLFDKLQIVLRAGTN